MINYEQFTDFSFVECDDLLGSIETARNNAETALETLTREYSKPECDAKLVWKFQWEYRRFCSLLDTCYVFLHEIETACEQWQVICRNYENAKEKEASIHAETRYYQPFKGCTRKNP